MPYRIVLIWQLIHAPVSPFEVIGGIGAAMVGGLMWAITADGLATSLTVVGLAACAVLARAIPIIKQGFLDYIEVKGRMRRELDATNAKVELSVASTVENKSAIVDLRAKEAEKDRLIEDLQRQVAEAERKALEVERAEAMRGQRREQETDILNGAVMEARSLSRETKAVLGEITRRSNDPDKEPRP